MSRLGFKTAVYNGDVYLGVLETVPVKNGIFQLPNDEIRIHHYTSRSDRCHPLSVFRTISNSSIRCKLEPCSAADLNSDPGESLLINLYWSCLKEFKTAVALLGNEEIHIVAMPSKQNKCPCFWCYSIPCGLYDSCLWMLNTRCLALVFDLDETLIVANTMKSFEDRIETLTNRVAVETDPIKESVMTGEMKRYIEDRAILKQYAETDSVVDDGKVLMVQQEEVPDPLLSNGHERLFRPVIRLTDKSIILTRINPENRDTSVLVRLRPAWEDLKSYLTAKGRRRFEVFVCTMAERHYALEIWRLLDPELRLIQPENVLDRIRCVKSGARKSLLSVFQDGICHPKMAMIVDDRLNVWEDKDQPHVHVVPPFTPYSAPQAENANAVPVLCVARNVACNVRACFFKEFDEILLRRIHEIFHEDEVVILPSAPDVSSYLVSEDASFIPNGILNVPVAEGMNGPEVAQRLQISDENNASGANTDAMTNNSEANAESSKLPLASASKLSQLPQPPISNDKEVRTEHENMDALSSSSSSSIGALQEIGRRCRSTVEFKQTLSTSAELQFTVEAYFAGEKVGVGVGKKRKDAHQQAAVNALENMAGDYVSYMKSYSKSVDNGSDGQRTQAELNGFVSDIVTNTSDARK